MFTNFQAIDINNILVLGNDRKLWLESAPFGSVPPKNRVPVVVNDTEISAFQGLDLELHVLVLGTDGNLWLEQVLGPPRVHIDGNVWAFQALDLEHVFVLGTDGNLWLWQAPFGKVPRVHIDSNVRPGAGGPPSSGQ